MTWLRNHPLSLAYILIVAVFASGLLGVQHEARQRQEALCETVNGQQRLLADLIDEAVPAEGGGGLPLTTLPSFDELDPATQAWARDIETIMSSGGGGSATRDRLREFAATRLTPSDCRRP